MSAPRGRGQATAVEVVRVEGPESPVGVGDGTITVVRLDPAQVRPMLLTREDGPPRPLPEWVRDESLIAGINASMFLPDGRSTGLLIDEGAMNNRRDNSRFGGFFSFRDGETRFSGRGCAGFDLPSLRRSPNLLQNYRMFGCRGQPIRWADDKHYSVAAFGGDRSGRILLIHSRTPYRVRDLNRMLARAELGIRHLHFVEGGPEASLIVTRPEVQEVGSYETDFNENDDNRRFWDLPNVLGFVAR
ncbi:MAG: phosphodiester glycosidase family protein [Myxococcota bacterium]